MTLNTNLLAHWYTALEAECGVWLTTPTPQRLMAALYTARSRSNDPRLNTLSIQISRRNPSGELWLVHKTGATG